MYAIIDFKGVQMNAIKDKIIKVPYLAEYVKGMEVEIKNVLMLKTDDDVIIGTPVIENARVIAEVLDHKREKKVIVFKKKRRKGYVKKQGHKQRFTQLRVKDIQI